jgi:peptide deformylase
MAKFKRRKRNASSPHANKALLQIRLYGDDILRQKALPVLEITKTEQKLAEDMLATMYAAPNGVGLAAPQVGALKRLIVIDINRDKPMKTPLVLFNPEVERLEGEVIGEEGCLSFPDITAEVKRAARVVAVAQDIDGELIRVEGDGLLARALQHEIDHLNGVLFIDHIGRLKRQLLWRKLRRLRRWARSGERALLTEQ